MQSRYYDPEICRFINADTMFDGNASFSGYNLFAYCANNPVKYADDGGKGIVLACCIIGAIAGFVSQYAGDVISNYLSGKRGAEMWKFKSTIGDYAVSVAFGALCAVPTNTILQAALLIGADIFVSPAASQWIDGAFSNSPWREEKYKEDVKSNISGWIVSGITGQFLPDAPEFIRDIKSEARAKGIKGTNKLNAYLIKQQTKTTIRNTMASGAIDAAWNALLTYLEKQGG